MTKTDMHQYQLDAVRFIAQRRKCALFLDMGMGKTCISLTAIQEAYDDMLVRNVLVIAPLRVANSVWQQEAAQWSHLQGLKVIICTGPAKQRLTAINSEADVHVINRENIPWLTANCAWKWDMLVIDESTSFKSHRAKKFKALRKVRKHLKSVVLLSGVPSPNGLMDLWSQLFLIDAGERLGRTITSYRQRFFWQNYSGFGYDMIPDSDIKIKSLIKDVCLSMKQSDYLQLPSKLILIERIELPEAARAQYVELKKTFILSLANDNDIAATSAAALGNKLLQISNGFIYDEHRNVHNLHTAKIELLQDLIADNPGENFLVAYLFLADLENLKRAFKNLVILSKSGKEIDDWNAGKIKLLVTHPASAGHGLNLQHGGNIIVWFGLPWSLELYYQFNARLYRQGQEKPVRIIHLVCNDCMDDSVLSALDNKAVAQNELLTYLRDSYHV